MAIDAPREVACVPDVVSSTHDVVTHAWKPALAAAEPGRPAQRARRAVGRIGMPLGPVGRIQALHDDAEPSPLDLTVREQLRRISFTSSIGIAKTDALAVGLMAVLTPTPVREGLGAGRRCCPG